MNNDCIFCKIACGEIPSYKIYEDSDFLSYLDIAPASDGHALVIPKEHYANLYEIPDDVLQKMIVLVKKIATKIKEISGCDGINIVQNNGIAAGQSVFHIHIHIIPRFDGDNALPLWKPGILKDEIKEKFIELFKEQ